MWEDKARKQQEGHPATINDRCKFTYTFQFFLIDCNSRFLFPALVKLRLLNSKIMQVASE